MKSVISKKLFSFFTAIFICAGLFQSASAQLTGTKNIPGDYPDLAAAITDLNTQGVGAGGVVLNLVGGNPQTAPAGGYVIGGTGSLVLTTASNSNPITLTGNSNIITASNALTAGALNDAIFKLIGADWVTIQGFTMTENSANTTTAAGTNNMTEWGVALLYVTTTDNATNVTIQNNTIDLDRTYQNTFGVYANATHSATSVTTSATATGANGGNSGLLIRSNNIQDINLGIVIIGPTAAADHNNGVIIGGIGAGNMITNFGTTGTFSGYANVSGTVNGMLIRNSINVNISHNTITSSVGGVTSGTLNGIQFSAFSTTPIGAFVNEVSNNSFSLQSGLITGAINGINYPSGSASTTSSLNINNNNFLSFGHTVAGTGAIIFILNASTHLNTSISNNTFSNITVNTTGSVTFISNSITAPANGTKMVNNNSIVTGFNKTGAGGTVSLYTDAGSSTTSTTIQNNNNNFSNITLTGATTITGWFNNDGTGSTPAKTMNGNTFTNWNCGTSAVTVLQSNFGNLVNFNNNVINNINGQGAITGMLVGSSGTHAVSSSLTGNSISNLTSSGTGGTVIGMSVAMTTATSGTHNISGNNVNTLSSNALTVTGITSSAGTVSLNKNKIYNLQSNNIGAAVVSGLLVSSGASSVTVENNLIGELFAPGASSSGPTSPTIRGINLTSLTATSNLNIQYNSVFIDANSTGANFATTALFHSTSTTATTAQLFLRNNILINTSTPAGTGFTVAYQRSSTTLTNYNSVSNNNILYADAPGASNLIFYDGTNSDQTIGAFKTRVTPRESSSVTEFTPFLSLTGGNSNFLHIDPAIPTQAESGGTTLAGVTTDFDGDTRNVTTPDIGADEGTFTPADLTPPAISYTQLLYTCSTGNRALTGVTISDFTGVNTGSRRPRVYYNKNNSTWFSQPGTLVSGTGLSGTWDFNIVAADMGGLTMGDIVYYYIIAEDVISPANVGAVPGAGLVAGSTLSVSTHPTNPYSYAIAGTLAGTFTVGAGGDYTTLTSAVNAYNTNCLTGAVVFNLTDALYNAGSGETFPIIINQNPGASSTNTLTIKPATGNTALVSANITGTEIRINGGDYIIIDGSNNGTDTRDLIFENLFTTSAGAVIWITDEGTTNGANNNTIKNTIIRGFSPSTTWAGIMTSGNASIGGLPVSTNNSNSYINNHVYRCQNGISLVGPAALETMNVVSGNDFGSLTQADMIGRRGVVALQQQGVVVSENEVLGIERNVADNDGAGINVGGITSGGIISKNIISNVKNINTGTWGISGILLSASSANAILEVSNNFISDVTGLGDAADIAPNGVGIRITTGGGYNIYHNTVALGTNQTNSGPTAALFNGNATATNLDVRNNIFANTQTNGTRYAVYSLGTNTVFSMINNNDYSAQNIGFLGSAQTSLANWQTATGQDANSVSILPSFTSTTDLHLIPANNAALNNLGAPLAGVTTDIDGDMRSVSTPDMGADEFTPPNCSAAAGGTATADDEGPFCLSGSTIIDATGYSGGVGSSYIWQSASDMAFTTPVDIGSPASFYSPLNTGSITSTTYYRLKVNCSIDLSEGVSSVTNPVVINNPQPLTTMGGTRCGTGTVDLSCTLNGMDDANWYANPTGGSPVGTGTTFTTPSISSTTTYYVAASSGGSTVNVGPLNPTAVGTVSSSTIAIGTQRMFFDVTAQVTILTIDIFPTATVGSSGSITIRNNAQQVLANVPYVTNVTGGNLQTITMNVSLPPGTGYEIGQGTAIALNRNTTGAVYPYTNGGVSITGNTFDPVYYYFFYNWSVSSGCEGARVPVIATVTAPPALTLSSSAETICTGSATPLISITSDVNDFDTYVWSPNTNVSGTPGGGYTFDPTMNTTYTLTASQSAPPLCSNAVQFVVTVNPLPGVSVSPAAPISINCGDVQSLTASINANVSDYIFTPSSGTFTPVTGGTDLDVIEADDTHSGAIPLGFSFQYQGNTYTDIYVNSNGWISFNSASGTATAAQWRANISTAPAVMLPLIAPLWDDIDGATANGGAASYVVTGMAPNRVFTMEWLNWQWDFSNTSPTISFQVKLYEGTNKIEFVYRQDPATPITPGASIGLMSSSTNYLMLDGTGPSPMALNNTFTTTLTGKPATGQIYAFDPPTATNYVWSGPSGTLFTNMAATTPYTGQNIATVYAKPNLSGTNTYVVTVTDGNGCENSSSRDIDVTGSCNVSLALTAFIEGYMDMGSMRPVLLNSGISGATSSQCDTITVSLHNSTMPYAQAFEFTGVLGVNGTLNCTFPAAANGNSYYVVVTHRNALETWSAMPQMMTGSNSYDFSTGSGQAFGGNMVQTGGTWCFYSGNIDATPPDDNIDLVDYPIWETDYNNFLSGYYNSDLNGDGVIDLIDYPIWETNTNNFISVIRP